MFRLRNLIKKYELFSFNLVKNLKNQRNYAIAYVKSDSKKKIGPLGWFLLIIPVSTFGLGTWQVQRKKWKENLIAELAHRSNSKPIALPEDLSELNDLEYYPIRVKGRFLHEKELYIGPRSLLKNGDSASGGGLISKGQNANIGYLVVTPFQLEDRDMTILVNRGWVPKNYKNPTTRKEGQITKDLDIVGILRANESRPNFTPANRPESNTWFYRDLEEMCRRTGAIPVFLDIVSECDVDGGPIGGQTRVNLRNEHLSYIFTWYSLSAFTSLMWYKQILRKI